MSGHAAELAAYGDLPGVLNGLWQPHRADGLDHERVGSGDEKTDNYFQSTDSLRRGTKGSYSYAYRYGDLYLKDAAGAFYDTGALWRLNPHEYADASTPPAEVAQYEDYYAIQNAANTHYLHMGRYLYCDKDKPKWTSPFQGSCNPAYPHATHAPASTPTGSPYTWAGLTQALWDAAGFSSEHALLYL